MLRISVAGAVLVVSVLTAQAQTIPLPSRGGGTIAMTGIGSVDVTPDTARVEIGITNQASDPKTALSENAERMNGIIDRFHALLGGLADIDYQLATTFIELDPVHRIEEGRRGEVIGFRASNSVSVSVVFEDDIETEVLGELMVLGLELGGNNLSGPWFSASDTSEATVRAREIAIRDAVGKAEQVAELLGQDLGAIVSVTERQGAMPRPMPVARALDYAAAAAPTIEVATQDVSLEVSISWRIAEP